MEKYITPICLAAITITAIIAGSENALGASVVLWVVYFGYKFLTD